MTNEADLQPSDTDTAVRLVHPDWIKNGRVVSAAFRKRPLSLWILERLPDSDSAHLHVDGFAAWSSIGLRVDRLRATTYTSVGLPTNSFDLEMTPAEAMPPLAHLRQAHASLTGPDTDGAPKALSEQFNRLGTWQVTGPV